MKSGSWSVLLGMRIAATLLILAVTAGRVFACGGAGATHNDRAVGAHQHADMGCPMMAKSDADMEHEPNMVEEKTCSAEMMQKYQFLATMPIYMDGPTVLYARSQELGLSEDQKTRLLAITEESRKKSLVVLTDEQRQKLGVISDKPITMSQICPMMRSESGNHHAHHAVKPVEPVKMAEQTVCPVMGGAINKDIFTEYQGKKVYFCCPACKPEFEKEPGKYTSKLPQFQK